MEKRKILIIDDEATLCELLKLNLESTGDYEVITATDSREGLVMVRKHLPDIVLLDIMMPYMDGSEVAEHIMRDAKTKHIPIIFLTALAEKSQVEANMGEIAGRQFIAKPVTTRELIDRIELTLSSK
jgi:CheY-like chemotaxis protein